MRLRYVTAVLLAWAAAASAQDLDPEAGRALFMDHCMQCHGADARGDGPMSGLLAVSTPDLTTISARNGGGFPTAEVAKQIDGRARVLAHGGDMPIFGPFLDTALQVPLRLPSGQTMMTGVPLAQVMIYLESIQGL